MLDVRTFVRCEINLIKSRIPLIEKAIFPIKQLSSLIREKNKIKYLGRDFFYDRKWEPILIAEYPLEIERILSLISDASIKEVIDIGANVGQWGLTMSKLNPMARVYSFEPNSEVYRILKKNSEGIRNWKVYNQGIGSRREIKNLYYSPEASAEGSFYPENLKQNTTRQERMVSKSRIIRLDKKTLISMKIPSKVDLIKIDVEGAEMECLKGIRDLEFKYLYIEASINRKGAGIKNIISFLEKNYKKKTKILFRERPDKESKSENVLIELE